MLMRRGPKPAKSKEAKPPVARKSPRDDARVRDLEKRLAEALDQQTATSEILRVISQSHTDLQPVFEAIVRSAVQLCEATFAVLHRFDGQVVTFDAHYGMTEQEVAGSRDRFPLPTDRGTAVGRAILDRQTTHIHDIRRDSEYGVRPWQTSFQTVLAVPLLREGVPVGAIGLWRREVQPFSEKQIKLIETFAGQAVIAIENVRLFTELQEKNRALMEAHAQVTEALDRQTATADILGVISQTQMDVQPVFEAIADSAMRLFGAWSVGVSRYDGELSILVAARGGLPGSSQSLMATWQAPHLPSHDSPVGRAVLSKTVQHVVDAETDPSWGLEARQIARDRGFRSAVSVPMLRGSDAIGSITVSRVRAGGFSATEIQLLQTFADQAVIAIENVRLFKELEARTQELDAIGERAARARRGRPGYQFNAGPPDRAGHDRRTGDAARRAPMLA